MPHLPELLDRLQTVQTKKEERVSWGRGRPARRQTPHARHVSRLTLSLGLQTHAALSVRLLFPIHRRGARAFRGIRPRSRDAREVEQLGDRQAGRKHAVRLRVRLAEVSRNL
jgi:hypothetical protein